MPPARIVIVRHGERVDFVHRTWSETAEMPNDSPLTDRGKGMARELGMYLARRPVLPEHDCNADRSAEKEKDPRSLAAFHPDNVIILASPLIRCIQTAHHIREGLLWTHGEDPESCPKVPIYPEEAMVETAYWQQLDYQKNSANVAERGDQRRGGLQLNPPKTAHGRLYQTPAYLQAEISPHVVIPPTATPCVSMLLPAATTPMVVYDPTEKQFVDAMDLEQRVLQAVGTLSAQPAAAGGAPPPPWEGKTVFLVGHGATTSAWWNGFTGGRGHPEVGYTAFAEIYPTPVKSSTVRPKNGAAGMWAPAPQVHRFHSPHLRQ